MPDPLVLSNATMGNVHLGHRVIDELIGSFDLQIDSQIQDLPPRLVDTAQRRAAANPMWSLSFGGLMHQAEDFSTTSAAGLVLSVPLGLGAEGSAVMFGQVVKGQIQSGGQVNNAETLDSSVSSNGALTLGVVAMVAQQSAAGNGAEHILGSVPDAAQRLYAAVHLRQFVGTDLTFEVQYDDPGFATPETALSFDAMSAPGDQHQFVAGPITSTAYRFVWSGTFTSFDAFCVIGIGD